MEANNHPCCCKRPYGRQQRVTTAILGLGIISLGLILTLGNLGMIEDTEKYLQFWPLLLVLLGLSHILRPTDSRRIIGGVIWIFVGTLLLLDNLDVVTFNVFDLWPIILIIVGIGLITKQFRGSRTAAASDADSFDATAILGGAKRRIAAADFRGGNATAILGGVEIDLRESSGEGPPAEINTFAFWGGIEIWVPLDWDVQVKGTAILGGFEDSRPSTGEGKKTLVVSGTSIMAGVEIKS